MSDSRTGAGEVAPAQPPRTQKIGRVVSDKMEKTVVVAVDSVRRHLGRRAHRAPTGAKR
jgi:ribosomal protein S17